ncbi:MAG: DMT family transporter, partial [Steroidobacteraceae bacterium]
MPSPVIYALVVLIWGTTWYAIKFQLGVVAPEISLVYRFGIATICVFIYARLTGSPLNLSWRDHRFVALQGLTLFCLNYWMTYLSTQYLTSGLVAVIFTTIILANMINARLIFGTKLEARVVIAAAAGMLGVALLFLPELQVAMGDRKVIHGALFALAATYLASLGNMAAMRNTRGGLPVLTVNAYGMAYGTIALALIAAIRGTPIAFDPSWPYIVSLLYLALAGT